MSLGRILMGTLVIWGAAIAPVAASPIVGQIDDFQDGTTMGWAVAALGSPNPAPPVNVPNGGPGGAGDAYLQLTSLGGVGPASRLVAFNGAQWAGDYLAAGVGAIAMDVQNLSTADLFLRLAFEDPMGGPPADVAFSTAPIILPASSGWTHVVFPVDVADLTAGLGSVNTALSNTTLLRLYHSDTPNFPNPVFPIPAIAAQLGVDNIQALASPVPEPATCVLLLGGGAAALRRVGRARRRRER